MFECSKNQSRGKRILALSLSLVLVCSLAPLSLAIANNNEQTNNANTTGAENGSQTGESSNGKNEIVYIKASANGEVEGIYVVNEFSTDTQEKIDDPGSYTNVKNLSTTEQLSCVNNNVELTTLGDGESFYYQGDLPESTKLPWGIDIDYFLDGKSVTPDEIAGQSGELKIVVDITSDDGDDFANGFLLQAQGTFPEDSFAIDDAGDATLARAGSNQIVSCLVLPGESATYEITGTARNFNYSGWQISAMSLNMAIDLRDQDLSELYDATDELENGTSELADGADALHSGAGALSDGVNSAAAGASQLASNSSSLTSGANSLAEGSSDINSALEQLTLGSAQYKAALESSKQDESSAAAAVQAAQQSLTDALTTAYGKLQYGQPVTQEDLAAIQEASTALAEASGTYGGAKGANTAIDGALSGYEALDSGISGVAAGTQGLVAGANELSGGLDTYTGGVDSIASGAKALKSGASELTSGSSTLANGAHELANAVDGMGDEIIDEIQSKIDEKLGGDFKIHSFVAPENTNVNSVQFVYVVEGIDEPDTDDADSEDDSDQDKTILDRFFALFSSEGSEE